MTRLTLLRHGRTEWNARGLLQGSTDIQLDEIGRDQARAAAERLAASGERWDAVVSSPLVRARETAELVAGRLALPLGPGYPEWSEQAFGVAEGLTDDEIERRWPDWRPPGVESDEALVERGLLALDRVAADYPQQDVIVVAHRGIIRYTLAVLTGKAPGEYPDIEPLAVSRAQLVDGAWRVSTIGGATVDVDVTVRP